ncbi:MAG: hypothetical protein ACLFWF_08260 [Alphaproteobacteria bacterium]
MLEQIAMDIWNNIDQVFLQGDYWSIGIAVVVALIAGFIMTSFGHIINTTFGALVVYGLAQVVRNVIEAGSDTSITTTIGNSWDNFMSVTMGAFVAYFIAFFVVITVFYIIFSAIKR